MKIGDHFSDNCPKVATIGFFDGVHRGHRFLIEQVRAMAAERRCASAVVTFPVHPRKVMKPEYCPQLLTTCREKEELLAATGVDYCLMLDFTPELACCSAHDFMALLKERYQIQALVIGYDHRFGHNRSESFDDYVRYGAELGMEVLPARPTTAKMAARSVLPAFAVCSALATCQRQRVVWGTIIFCKVRW